ncbi:Sugar lactone lactonase YvrE [Novosphingobium sp. CF614]|uniref:SMP-30/gluconolactonase/LRE family protein n=1 Tax=Novosphingobium sp. CF614 TaxID=1884364 RepID=UPI0008EE24C6|nr:SMP-30/gluconolactonase/LRE family protein [Novosphingobium sp. CF614]SFF85371.1 Sugar lactone lactonase YvrE [Novosphingobium sp. CF614]
MSIVPEVAWRLECLLGEGPVWFAADQSLRFVDIKQGHIHRFDPATGTGESVNAGGKPGFIVPAANGTAVVGDGHRLYRLDGTGPGETLAEVDMPRHNRINDGTLSPDGVLWFGTMDDEENLPTGSIFRFVGTQIRPTALRAVVTNGPAFSPDGKVLYVADSGSRRIWRFDPGEDPMLERGEPFIELNAAEGYPDGVVTDAEGCLWVGLWDGWGVRRYSPQGEVMLHVALPCARVTKLAFGGPDLTTAFVTTARIGLDSNALAGQPLAGSLFQFDAPVRGWVAASCQPD